MFRHDRFSILTSIITIAAIFSTVPTFAAIDLGGPKSPLGNIGSTAAIHEQYDGRAGGAASSNTAKTEEKQNSQPEAPETEEKKKNIFQKAGDLGKKGLDGVKSAGSKVGELGKKGIDGIKSGASAVTGVFKHNDPCDEADDTALKGKDTNIEKTKLKDGKCIVAKCKKGFTANDDKTGCEKSEGECTPTDENATAGELKKGKCIITECGNGWHPSEDSTKCEQAELSEKDSQDKVNALKDNARAMKDKEQSTANKMLGAAAIGATGIGGMNLMSGMAEQKSDQAAEEDMKAYLATFVCDYGAGRNIKGGEMNIDLPGGNDLLASVTEYRALAADLKARKEALGKQPGIESEVIYDISETGLYDNVGMGRQSGAYTSLSRALTDENSKDAEEWAKQKADTASKIKTGAITAGAGAIGGLVGNLAINSGEKNKNQANKIIADYDKKKQAVAAVQKEANKVKTTAKCSDFGLTGDYPDCNCSNNSQFFNKEEGSCQDCENPKIFNGKQCVCPTNMRQTEKGECKQTTPECNLSGILADSRCACGENAHNNNNTCECTNGFQESNGKCVCPSDTHEINDDKCEPKVQTPLTIKLSSDGFFASGSATFTDEGNAFLNRFNTLLSDALAQNNLTQNDIENYHICIVGHTDRTKFKSKNKTNKALSEERANAVQQILANHNPTKTNIQTYGRGPDDCITSKYPHANDKNCRRVDVTLQPEECNFENRSTQTGGGTN